MLEILNGRLSVLSNMILEQLAYIESSSTLGCVYHPAHLVHGAARSRTAHFVFDIKVWLTVFLETRHFKQLFQLLPHPPNNTSSSARATAIRTFKGFKNL